MPVNQGSNFNFNTSNPYAFDDWGGVGQAPLNSTRGTYAGPGGHMNFRYPSTVTYTSASDAGYKVFGMHQKAPRSMAIANGTSVNGQLSQLQSGGAWFNWTPAGRTTFRFQGDNTSYQTSSPGYIYPASPTNPPFVILDLLYCGIASIVANDELYASKSLSLYLKFSNLSLAELKCTNWL